MRSDYSFRAEKRKPDDPTHTRTAGAPAEDVMLKTDYSVEKASTETREAMADRCHEEGHNYDNCMSVMFRVYQKCKWCGAER